MSSADESENASYQSSRRTVPDGWHVISSPARRQEPEADELKSLIQSMGKGRRTPGGRRPEEAEPPEAA